MTPAEKQARRAEIEALRDKYRNEAVALVTKDFGPPTEPHCRDWPHALCVKWTLPNGAEIHVHANPDGPYIDAFSGCDAHARWEGLNPADIMTLSSIKEWLASVNMFPKE